jgi:hypothetical protein
MVYSDTSSKDGLMQNCEFFLNMQDAEITADATLKARFTGFFNYACRLVFKWIQEASQGWTYDDSNNTDFPIATTTLVNNQRDYSLNTTMYNLRSVEVMDSAGDYHELPYNKLGEKKYKEQRWQEDSGMPQEYWMEGNSIMLYPKPNTSLVTAAEGLRIWFDQTINVFTTSDTTQAPGFIDIYHPIIYLLACEKYAMSKGDPARQQSAYIEVYGDGRMKKGLKKEMQEFYSKRNKDNVDKLSLAFDRSIVM